MRIALIGQAAFGADVLKGLLARGQQVAGVFCPPDRGGRLTQLKRRPAPRACRFFSPGA